MMKLGKGGISMLCSICQKPIDEHLEGRETDRKERTRLYKKRYREENAEKIAESKRRYAKENKEKILAYRYKYKELNKEKSAEWQRKYQVKYRKLNQSKIKARQAVRLAVKSGKIVKPKTCQAIGCFETNIESHHDNYNKPLEVRWLCRSCHTVIHI